MFPPEAEEQNRTGWDTLHISVPCELVMGLLAQGTILQMQISPVPLRPDLARPTPMPDSANTRPDTADPNTRPDVANTSPRPDSGRPQASLNRPEKPASRCPPTRLISPYTDWSSLSDQADVISIHSDNSDNNYVPRSPAYEPDSPGPVEESEDWDPTPVEEAPEGQHAEPSRAVCSNIFTDSRDNAGARDSNARPRTPLGRRFPIQRVPPFVRGIGQRRRNYVKYDYM